MKKRTGMIRIIPYLLFITLVCLLFFSTDCKKASVDQPNIVIIVIDTLRADHLPFYGYKKNTAPFLNKLAEKSVIFEKTFAPSSLTAPSTASLFTSFYPFQHGVVINIGGILNLKKKYPNFKIKLNKIPAGIPILGEVLKKAGYRNYGVSDNINIGDKMNFDRGFDHFYTYNYKAAAVINKKVKELSSEILKQKKYFLYIHYMDPHQPLHERKPWYEKKDDKIENIISLYDSEINYVDQKIEELFNLFHWDRNTLLLVTADHGEELWEHGNNGHGYSLYKEVIHVPFMVYYPQGGFFPRKIVDMISLIDLLPTISEFVQIKPGKDIEGISLLPLLKKSIDSIPQRFLYAQVMDHNTKSEILVAESTIYGKWHYIKTFSGSIKLYNLKFDFEEKYNQFGNDLGIARQLASRYHHFENQCKKFKQQSFVFTLDKKEMDRLKTLGYVN